MDKKHGFTVKEERTLPELDCIMYRMTHDRTGAELVWLKRDDENKTFGICFPTYPFDDTGVFHILEHSVLCGSERYPVKEPFVELKKSSMNTFLNAMTFKDKTFYPISSTIDKDFYNLMRIYLDAVFRPSIYTKTEVFMQEGWHLEFSEDGSAGYNGVVLNEMKGYMSDPDEIMSTTLLKMLFPDSPAGFCSGGDPACIPTLTYEEFLDTHRRFYSPSNSYIFLDGDMDIDEVLSIIDGEYLCMAEAGERIPCYAKQQPVCVEKTGFYELDTDFESDDNTRLSLGYVTGDFGDREKRTALSILSEYLCANNKSPLCAALLEEGLCGDVSMGVSGHLLQPYAVIDIKKIKSGDADKVYRRLNEILSQIRDNGTDKELLYAIMAQAEFGMREMDYGSYPKGLVFGMSVMESMPYGGDPALGLEVGDLFEKLKKKTEKGYFEDLIGEVFLDNPHRAKLVLQPSFTLGEERREAERKEIERRLASMSDEELAGLKDAQERLLAWQNSEDSEEALATIPTLSLEDIPEEPERINSEESESCGIRVLRHKYGTGGIDYVSLLFDAGMLCEEELTCLALICGLMGMVQTKDLSAGELAKKKRLLTGEMRFVPALFADDDGNAIVKLGISFSCVEKNLKEATELVCEILRNSVFDEATCKDILYQIVMDLHDKISMSGHVVAMNRAAAQLRPYFVAVDCVRGLAAYRWFSKTADEDDLSGLLRMMGSILDKVIRTEGMLVGVTGTDDEAADTVCGILSARIPEGGTYERHEFRPYGKKKEGILVPSDVSYAAVMGDVHDQCLVLNGHMALASQIISLGYLWNSVRVQGGAYGTGMVSREGGLIGCYSYRDPDGALSLEKYRECAEFLRSYAESTDDHTGYIIGTVASISELLTPKAKGKLGERHFITGRTWESRCRRRKELLSSTSEDLLKLTDGIGKALKDGAVCIVGGKAQIDKCRDLDVIETL